MNTIDWKTLATKTSTALRKHAPAILTGIGISGMVTTTVLAVRATPEALRCLDEKKKTEQYRKLTPVQMVQVGWRCYIPAGVTGALSVACLISASAMNGRRNAALATAYTLAENTLRDYRSKVVETIGERKEENIREAIDRDRVEKDPPPVADAAFIEGTGSTLCYDGTFGGYFYSDKATMENAANKLNRQMSTMTEPYVSLNEFYAEIGRRSVKIGDKLGWNVDKGLIDLRFTSQLAGGRTPCLVVDYTVVPEYDYY